MTKCKTDDDLCPYYNEKSKTCGFAGSCTNKVIVKGKE